jgi:hypothetical protein
MIGLPNKEQRKAELALRASILRCPADKAATLVANPLSIKDVSDAWFLYVNAVLRTRQ